MKKECNNYMEWDTDGDLHVHYCGYYDCREADIYFTPEEFDQLLKERPMKKEADKEIARLTIATPNFYKLL